MAKIRQRGSTYTITVSNGYINGKQITVSETYKPTATTPAKIEKEVNAEAIRFEDEVKNGKYRKKEKMHFASLVDAWYENYGKKHLTQSQHEQYLWELQTRINPVIGKIYLDDISLIAMQEIFNNMEKDGYSPKTLRRTFTALNSVMTYALRKKLIESNECNLIDLPKLKETEGLHFFSPEEGRRFLQFLNTDYELSFGTRNRKDSNGKDYPVKGYKVAKQYDTQTRCYFTLALLSAMRRGEQIALTWEDIDFTDNTVSINKAVAITKTGVIVKGTKTSSGRRVLQLPTEAFDMLSEWKREEYQLYKDLGTAWKGEKDFEKTWVFIQADGSRMHPTTPSHKFKQIIKRYNASIEIKAKETNNKAILKMKLPDIHLHDLRHSAITALIASGMDVVSVSHFAGHSKPSITMDVYSHYLQEKDSKMANSLTKAFSLVTASDDTKAQETARVLN